MAEWSIYIPGTQLGMKHYSDQLKDLSQALSEIPHSQIEIQLTEYSDKEVLFFLVKSHVDALVTTFLLTNFTCPLLFLSYLVYYHSYF